MLENFYLALFSFFFFTGVLAVLFCILMAVIRPRGTETNYIVTVLDENEKNAVARIGYLLTRVTASGDKKHTRIIAVDNGMTTEQYRAVRQAFSTESCVLLCPRAAFELAVFGDG